ncbi:MAG TPA: M28 family peptidase, partial [Ignavibacteria bacterium]|nr:M28 family peptidase [Ignavibacteria bacterium]
LFGAHWDTRPRAEHAKNPANRDKPILGANDGGSGSSILLELARLLKTHKVNYGVDLVFFDGEDYGKENDLNNFCIGSKYFAAKLNINDIPAFGILLDMVGDKQAVFPEEQYSLQYAPGVVNMIWNIAAHLNAGDFSSKRGGAIYDDHIPLNQAGLPTIDIIDSGLIGDRSPIKRRNYWHSENDTMKNIGKNTLQQVGNVLTYLIYSIQFNSEST